MNPLAFVMRVVLWVANQTVCRVWGHKPCPPQFDGESWCERCTATLPDDSRPMGLFEKLPGEPPRWPVRPHYEFYSPDGVWDYIVACYIPVPVYRVWNRVRHPKQHYYRWKFDRQKPKVGGQVLYHYEGPYTVLEVDGDDLWIDGPHGRQVVSWSNCCDPVGTPVPDDLVEEHEG